MMLDWKRITVALVGLAAAGMLFAWSGLLDIRASTGHWRVTDWFLHWVMRSSVRTAALGTTPQGTRNARGSCAGNPATVASLL